MSGSTTDPAYVHGYTDREAQRLEDQAATLEDLLHAGTAYPPGSRVLEVGCGVGAQTVALARRSPEAHILAVDRSASSLERARTRVEAAGFHQVRFRQADLYQRPFAPASFDHVFLCFVLEHLREPRAMLAELRDLLVPGGTLTVIEGDHGSAIYQPPDADAQRAIDSLVDLQARSGGHAHIGRALYPLLAGAGFLDVRVHPCPVYADAGRPAWVEGFTRNTFTAMVEGVREDVLRAGLMDAAAFDRGIAALQRSAGPDGTFFYSFFKGVGRV